jgi:hypothetical protein
MRPRTRQLCLAAACGLAVFVTLTPARAGEKEWVVTPSPTYSVLRADGRNRHGGGLFFDVDYGLTDSWALRGTAHYGGHAVTGSEGGLLSAGGLGLGVLYTFDVLKVVPYASLAVGAEVLAGPPLERPRWEASFQAGFGLDYLVNRDFSVGLELRYLLLVPDVRAHPFFLCVSVRLSWRRQ